MKNFLKINWNELNELGKKTTQTAELFEEGRYNFEQIIKSLNECWEGQDAFEFSKNSLQFLEYLKGDSNYLASLGRYYSNSSKSYNETVSTNAENIKKKTELLDPEKRGELL